MKLSLIFLAACLFAADPPKPVDSHTVRPIGPRTETTASTKPAPGAPTPIDSPEEQIRLLKAVVKVQDAQLRYLNTKLQIAEQLEKVTAQNETQWQSDQPAFQETMKSARDKHKAEPGWELDLQTMQWQFKGGK